MRLGPVAGIAVLAGFLFVIGWPMWASRLRRRVPPAVPPMPVAGLERNLAIGLAGLAAVRASMNCSSLTPVLLQAAAACAAGYWLANMWNRRQV